MPQPQNLVVISVWLTQAVTLLRSAWWQVCGCMRDSTRDKPYPKWWLCSGNGLIRLHHEERHCWIGEKERKTTCLEMCSGSRFHWMFPTEIIVRAWCATVNNARPHEERLECEAILPNFHEWTVGWRHGSVLWIMLWSAGHILKCLIPLKGSFQWRMCHLSQCTQQKCGVLVKGESQFHTGAGT